MGLGWKSLNTPLLWAPLCGANKDTMSHGWFLLKLEILQSELLEDFVSASVALEINSTVWAGDHLWIRGEREWLLDVWEREWLSPFPNIANGNGNEKLYSQFLGTGTGIKIPFPIFGNGNGNGNSIPECWEREWDVVIPWNDREREYHRKIEWTFL